MCASLTLWRDFGFACLNPADLRLVALQRDHLVTDVSAPAEPGTGIAGLAHGVLADLVVFAIEEGLVAVGMIGDESVRPAVFADLDESRERLFVDQQAHVGRARLESAGRERAGKRAASPEGKQVRPAVIGHWHQERNRARRVARREIEGERRVAEGQFVAIGDVYIAWRRGTESRSG